MEFWDNSKKKQVILHGDLNAYRMMDKEKANTLVPFKGGPLFPWKCSLKKQKLVKT